MWYWVALVKCPWKCMYILVKSEMKTKVLRNFSGFNVLTTGDFCWPLESYSKFTLPTMKRNKYFRPCLDICTGCQSNKIITVINWSGVIIKQINPRELPRSVDWMEGGWYCFGGLGCQLAFRYSTTIHISASIPSTHLPSSVAIHHSPFSQYVTG